MSTLLVRNVISMETKERKAKLYGTGNSFMDVR